MDFQKITDSFSVLLEKHGLQAFVIVALLIIIVMLVWLLRQLTKLIGEGNQATRQISENLTAWKTTFTQVLIGCILYEKKDPKAARSVLANAVEQATEDVDEGAKS